MVSRKQRSLFIRMINDVYKNEVIDLNEVAKRDGVPCISAIDIFRFKHKHRHNGLNTYKEYLERRLEKKKAELDAKKHYREVVLPQLKKQRIANFENYLAHIRKK